MFSSISKAKNHPQSIFLRNYFPSVTPIFIFWIEFVQFTFLISEGVFPWPNPVDVDILLYFLSV